MNEPRFSEDRTAQSAHAYAGRRSGSAARFAPAAYARSHASLSLGLHFDFGEWRYRDGNWVKLYEVVPEEDAKAVQDEAWRQIAEFRRLTGTQPTHLDSHQHTHRRKPLEPVFLDAARELNVPLRSYDSRIHYYGGFFCQDDPRSG